MGRDQHTWRMLRLTGWAVTRCKYCGERHEYLTRPSRQVLGKAVPAPSLEPFDTLRVFGRYETDAPKVSIFGEVLRPGEYPLSEK